MTVGMQPLPFDEAIAFFRAKTPLLPEQYAELEAAARARAFSVSGISRMDVMNDLFEAMDKSISDGLTFRDFQGSVRATMQRRGWEGLNPYRLDTIFRTNIQSAYQAGHYEQMMESAASRPYWQYVAVMDSRTRPSHAAMNGKVFPQAHPFWRKNFPPNGFNCRCTVVSLSRSELDRDGLSVQKTYSDIADKGFETNPGEASYKPDLNKRRPEFATVYLADAITGPDYQRFFEGKAKGQYPVAVLNKKDMDVLETENSAVMLSSETISSHVKHGMSLEDYQKLPVIIAEGEVYRQGDLKLIYLWDDGILYRAAVKTTAKRDENYVVTFFKTNDKDADRQIRRKLERIR